MKNIGFCSNSKPGKKLNPQFTAVNEEFDFFDNAKVAFEKVLYKGFISIFYLNFGFLTVDKCISLVELRNKLSKKVEKQIIKRFFITSLSLFVLLCSLTSCNGGNNPPDAVEKGLFRKIADLSLGRGVPEITAYDPNTKRLFVVNTEKKAVDVVNLSDPNNPILGNPILITSYGGNLNSVDVKNGKLAIAVEGNDKTLDLGKLVLFNTNNLNTPWGIFDAGYLPDMVKFTPDGNYLLAANEGEPNDDYTVDPEGSITILDVVNKNAKTINFEHFNTQETVLASKYFRVFGISNGSSSSLSDDVEPEYIAISSDSKTAWVTLQENNGIAKVDIISKQITDIYPLGVKDFNETENKFDLSDKDNTITLRKAEVKGYYQPDGIDYFQIGNTGYIIIANEGDPRDYSGFSEEKRVADILLDASIFPNASELQASENLGRLKISLASGDGDDDGDFEELFAFGGRSFSILDVNGNLVYDSGNKLTQKSIELGTYPDSKSDDKGVEPEGVTTYTSDSGKVYAVLGLEKSGDVLIYDITTPSSPTFVQHLPGNTSPEGLLIIPNNESPNGKTLLIVSNEYPKDAKLNIYAK